jgi:uncharacterized protein (DUF1330 family)
MSAYVVFTRTKTIDQKELEKYRTGIKATMKDHPIEVLVAVGKHEVLEGDPTEGMVLVKFPSVKAAKDWIYSEAYQNVAKHRKHGAALLTINTPPGPTVRLSGCDFASPMRPSLLDGT